MADDPKDTTTDVLEADQPTEGADPNTAAPAKSDDPFDGIFDEEHEVDDRLSAFQDLEPLTMIEVASEVEAVLEELRIRQGG